MMTRRLTYAPLILLALTLAILYFPVLRGEIFYWGLPTLQFYPWRHLAVELLRDGILPLWTPYNGAGAPLLANYQSALLYPPSWISFALPLEWSMSLTAVVHLWIAGWGMWTLTGRLGVSALGRGVSMFAFAMTNYLVARLFTFPIIEAAAWLPWIAWAALGVLMTGRRQVAWLALFAALQLLAGHAQTTWYSLTLVGALCLWWTVFHASGERGVRALRLFAVVLALALGAGIAALQLAPTAELLMQSQRGEGVDYWVAMNFSYNPVRTLNFLSPVIFGTPADGTFITQGAYFEDAVYIGFIPLIGAFAAVIAWRRRRAEPVFRGVPFWLSVVIVGFAFALGRFTPIFPFLYEHVPTFAMFQAPVRWQLWTVFGLSVLAGIGVSAWGRGRSTKRWARRLLVASVGMLVVLLALLGASGDSRALIVLTRALIGIAVLLALAAILTLTQPEETSPRYGRWMTAALLVIAVDLVIASAGLNPTVGEADFLQAVMTVDTASLQGRGQISKLQEEAVKVNCFFRFDDYRGGLEQGCSDTALGDLPNANSYTRTPMLNNFDPLLVGHFARYQTLTELHPDLAALRHAAAAGENADQRAWFVESACWHETQAELEAALVDPNWNPAAQVHLLGAAGCQNGDAVDAPITVTDRANTVTISVNAPRMGWLYLADTDYPGWKAFVDGEPVPIYRANLMFRAVQVDGGLHEVVFSYEPDWMLPAALITVVSLGVLLFLFTRTD
jgi:hypothetical protein